MLDMHRILSFLVGEQPSLLLPEAESKGIGQNTDGVIAGQLLEIGLYRDKICRPVLLHDKPQTAIGRTDIIGQ